jgi:hypothetical protein
MDKMVEHFQDDLIPVAAQLSAKLVRTPVSWRPARC